MLRPSQDLWTTTIHLYHAVQQEPALRNKMRSVNLPASKRCADPSPISAPCKTSGRIRLLQLRLSMCFYTLLCGNDVLDALCS
ncbi:hypothetical protein HBI75_224290 [Parastagonospora nodorum]|nr:hypothetical protein HBH48_072380 [Parastagonospora nodorum]KAH4879520.1 hypothetical protein HBH58_083860 [Parastagonospora nodorum]KAH5006175.1 hypothetical protein HBI75_224290 [Parastagonospora nodorum]